MFLTGIAQVETVFQHALRFRHLLLIQHRLCPQFKLRKARRQGA